MRPTSSPSMSRTMAPRRSSTFTSMSFLLLSLLATAWNVLDDVACDPDLPVNGTDLPGLDIHLDISTHGLHARPGDFHRAVALRTPHSRQARRELREDRVQSHPERLAADQDVRDPGLGILTDLHNQTADPTHVAVLAVHEFLVENVAHQVHVSRR